jgi:hypothetical protein
MPFLARLSTPGCGCLQIADSRSGCLPALFPLQSAAALQPAGGCYQQENQQEISHDWKWFLWPPADEGALRAALVLNVIQIGRDRTINPV